jgi:hypothetical protein
VKGSGPPVAGDPSGQLQEAFDGGVEVARLLAGRELNEGVPSVLIVIFGRIGSW